jgi:hypothetical protein
MMGPRDIILSFDTRAHERLVKLFRQLGTDNLHEADTARGRIASLLQKFNKSWADLIALLGNGATLSIQPGLVADIAGLGDPDPVQRADARHRIMELLARHRMTWNDLADALCGVTLASWLSSSRPDPQRVDPITLIVHLLKEYVALKEHEYLATALWAMHTHIYRHFMVTPRLVLRSPVAGCGKTVLLDILAKLVSVPKKVDSITTAALFRLIDETHATMLVDEADNLMLGLRGNGRLRSVFNAGHRHGGNIVLLEDGEAREFSIFAPLALALPDAAGGLPRTLNSRSITMMMERSSRKLKRFDALRPDFALDAAYEQILLWRNDVELDDDPPMLEGLNNRIADNWRPLVAIASSLGWGNEAREAAVIFAKDYQDADVRISLLTDIRRAFDADGHDRLSTEAMLEALYALDDADWNEFCGVRGDQAPHKLKDSELASLLKDFKIRSRSIWPLVPRRDVKSSKKGYRRAWFEGVWRAYCSDDGTAAQSSKPKGLRLASGGTGDGT